ncbi:hypothetical protein A5641_11910 [Mycobacterium sp. 1554424.7]|nr:hypothetical protein A5641_11910 [Mycobacterium sp. 1554424.7]
MSVTLMRIGLSLAGIGALSIGGLFVYAIFFKRGCAGWEDPALVPALLTLQVGFIAMITGLILVFALLIFRGYRWWRERQGSRMR